MANAQNSARQNLRSIHNFIFMQIWAQMSATERNWAQPSIITSILRSERKMGANERKRAQIFALIFARQF